MIKRVLISAAIAMSMATAALADASPEPIERKSVKLSELVTEYANCGAFFQVALDTQASILNPEVDLREATRDAIFLAARHANMIGKTIGLSEAAYGARVRIAVQNHYVAMDHNLINFAVLADRFGNRCTWIMSNPVDAVIEALL